LMQGQLEDRFVLEALQFTCLQLLGFGWRDGAWPHTASNSYNRQHGGTSIMINF